MILNSLTLQNFGPYRTKQHVTFPRAPTGNLMIVYGDNMRGKTSFLNSIRWCLYGDAIGRGSRVISYAQITNYDARKVGDYATTVSLSFSHDGSDWQLTRTMDRATLIADPRSNADYSVTVVLERDGNILNASRVTDEINRILPKAVSRFFLFDGELLQEYEELLTASSSRTRDIKSSIESILGIPALLRTRSELGPLLKRAQQANAKDLQNVEKERDLSRQFEVETERSSTVESDIEDLKADRDKIRAQKLDLDAEVDASEALLEARADLDLTIRDRAALVDRHNAVLAECREVNAGAWQDLLQARLSARIRDLFVASENVRQSQSTAKRLRDHVHMLTSTLDQGACSLCHAGLSHEKRSSLTDELTTAADEARAAEVEADELARARPAPTIPTIPATGARARLVALNRQLADLDRQMYAFDERSKVLEAEIKGRDTDQLAQKRRTRDRFAAELLRLENDTLPKRESDLLAITKKLRALSALMRAANPNASKLRSTVEAQVYDELQFVFSAAIDRFRDEKRARVAQRASEAFARLSTEQTFQRLEINDNYGLQIIDREGRFQESRSAGAEQIVALSLIEALNSESLVQGPMIMDTPFGRLDQRHRTNVLEYSSRLAPQVVFLVHSGEVSMEQIRSQFSDRIGALYRVERISSSESTLLAEPV